MRIVQTVIPLLSLGFTSVPKLLISNDDGWATAQIRAQYTALSAAGFDVLLSAPAQDSSGTGSRSRTPTPTTEPCEFDTCPAGSPAEGPDPNDDHIYYVNAYPSDAVKYGVQTLSPKFFNSTPDLIVSGPNIGSNVGLTALISGTVGAACEGARQGIPSIAFSGASGSHVSYTTLETDASSASTAAALIYSELTTIFVQALLSGGASPLLPPNTILNVNYAPIDDCASASDYEWVFSRQLPRVFGEDVDTCGSKNLPNEASVIKKGCYASVTVLSSTFKADVDRDTQAVVLQALNELPFSCLSSE